MRNKIVKGFTLVELVVVMAIFSIIMFGAMQLMQPANRMFLRSYSQEDASAAQKNIKNYLESTLRYVQYVTITADEPSDDDIRNFVTRHYNGKVNSSGSLASGKVYKMVIDNTNGGRISQWEYSYTASNLNPANTGTAASISLTSTNSNVINEAMYNDYSYLISLGMVTPGTGVEATDPTNGRTVMVYTPSKDTDYYDKYSDTSMGTFSSTNMTFSISSYSGRIGTDYVDMHTMTATASLINCKQESYLHHDWSNVGTALAPDWMEEREALKNADGTPKLDPITHKQMYGDLIWHDKVDASTCGLNLDAAYQNSITESSFVEPDRICFIYSYPERDIH